MSPIQDRLLKKSSAAMADYDALLARAVDNLPNSSPTARAALYKRTRTALISELRSAKQPISIESELRVLDDAIDRLEARIKGKKQEAPTPSTILPGPTKSEPARSGGWLNDLLARASRDDASTVQTASNADRPLRSPVLLKMSEGVVSSDTKQPALPVASVGAARIERRSIVQDTAQAVLGSGTAQEKPMSRSDELNRVLRKLQHDSPGVEASALISEDGLMIASALAAGMEEARVAGMTATLLNLGSRAAIELSRGGVQEVVVRGELGYAVLISAGRGALLLALTNESSKLGLVFFDMREAVRALAKVL
jgi:predicted regulator of Ras-like GTPase activity (Roadblock/LC7/MglB family)